MVLYSQVEGICDEKHERLPYLVNIFAFQYLNILSHQLQGYE